MHMRDLTTGMSMQPTNIDPKIEGLCPFLGFCDDRDTALSYPSNFNCCFKSKPVVPVSFYHQKKTCLSKNYLDCSVYKSASIIPLPNEMVGKYPRAGKFKFWQGLIVAIIVILIGVTVSALFGVFNLSGVTAFLKEASITMIPPLDSLPLETNTVLPPTSTNTQTLAPTGTDTPIFPTAIAHHLLETTFGENPELVLHRVLEGEAFILLANTYNTSAEAIQAINYGMENTLFAYQVIVIPVNTTDITSLPAFTVFEVIEDNLLIETVAIGFNVDIDDLRQYNHLPEGYILTKGEWLLIPR